MTILLPWPTPAQRAYQIQYRAGMARFDAYSVDYEPDSQQEVLPNPSDSDSGSDRPSKAPTSRQAKLFLDQLSAIVMQHLDDPGFTVEALAKHSNMSRTHLHRKLREFANTNATLFIRDARLARAAELLTTDQARVTEVAYAVGFSNLSYFARLFHARYGLLPSQYVRINRLAT